uniref:Uncharacterized protein n=1 Tax=Galaxaura rugosa TaxID=268570 RepID=A0A1G4NTA8_9FLOR|nr:Hypothetical protein ORF_6 [Galaxaura rugosa]SCW21854.1 Hypothetical protein ORF_6 [Galaxaura rugosa]
MDDKIFVANSFDLIMITINALDTYTIDDIIRSNHLDIQELFLLRTKNYMRYQLSLYKYTNYQYLKVIQNISKIISQDYIQHNITDILRDIIRHQHNIKKCSLKTKNYIKKFTVNYRKVFQPYLIGYLKYINNKHIEEISVLNLYFLYIIYINKNSLYFTCLQTIYNSHK